MSSEIRTQSAPSNSSMLKISASSSGESSTITRTSVWGLKYVPGRMVSSSSSNLRGSAIRVERTGCARRGGPEVPERADLALDLRLDVERRLAKPRAPMIAGNHQLADLGP